MSENTDLTYYQRKRERLKKQEINTETYLKKKKIK